MRRPSTRPWLVRCAAVVGIAVVLAGCGGDGAAPTTTVPPRSTTEPTTATTTEPCTAGLAAALGIVNTRFDIVPEPDIFVCFGATSFRSFVAYEGTPLDAANPLTGSVSVTSEQLETGGEVRSRTVAVVGGATYETIAIGDDVTMADGTPAAGSIPDEAITAQGAVGTLLADAVLELGVLAAPAGAETVNGRSTTHHRADGEAIAQSFEEAIARNGGGNVDLVFPDTALDVWVDDNGYVVKATFSFDFAAATADGAPVGEVDLGGVTVAELIPAGTGVLSYELSGFGETFDIQPPG